MKVGNLTALAGLIRQFTPKTSKNLARSHPPRKRKPWRKRKR